MKIFRELTEEQRQELKNEIVKLFAAGLSQKEVIRSLGITADNIQRLRKKDKMFDHKIIREIYKAKDSQ